MTRPQGDDRGSKGQGAGHVALGDEADDPGVRDDREPGLAGPVMTATASSSEDIDVEGHQLARLRPARTAGPGADRGPGPRPGSRCRGSSPSRPGCRRAGRAGPSPRRGWPGSRRRRPPCPWSGGRRARAHDVPDGPHGRPPAAPDGGVGAPLHPRAGPGTRQWVTPGAARGLGICALPSTRRRTYVRTMMERRYEIESLRRSLAMLRPGAPAARSRGGHPVGTRAAGARTPAARPARGAPGPAGHASPADQLSAKRLVGSARTSPTARGRARRPARRPAGGRRPGSGSRRGAGRRPPRTPTAAGRWRPMARMAASPGLRMGTPASTPKTPTLVRVMVPPRRSSGVERACAGRGRQLVERPHQLAQRQILGVLDVGHDQAVWTGHRDAQVHVVLRHDLAGGARPTTSSSVGWTRSASTTARATTASGVTWSPSK